MRPLILPPEAYQRRSDISPLVTWEIHTETEAGNASVNGAIVTIKNVCSVYFHT